MTADAPCILLLITSVFYLRKCQMMNRSSRLRQHHLMQDSHTQTKQETVGRTTVIISDVLIEKEKSLNHAIGLGGIIVHCAQENGLVFKVFKSLILSKQLTKFFDLYAFSYWLFPIDNIG